jgi:hypothetical protein
MRQIAGGKSLWCREAWLGIQPMYIFQCHILVSLLKAPTAHAAGLCIVTDLCCVCNELMRGGESVGQPMHCAVMMQLSWRVEDKAVTDEEATCGGALFTHSYNSVRKVRSFTSRPATFVRYAKFICCRISAV